MRVVYGPEPKLVRARVRRRSLEARSPMQVPENLGHVFAQERQRHIARLVEEHGRVRVADLAARFGVSTVTIRKDLLALELQGALSRTHGGALVADRNHPERAFEIRERFQPDQKEAIGVLAASMVVDGESIALDASTTALAMARHLKASRAWANLTVITNGLRIASELAGYPGITVVMPGGFVRWEALSVVGPLGDGLFRKVNVQKAFMGAAGFTLAAGLSDATPEEAEIKRLMVAGAHEVIAIVDHTKWQRTAFATFCRTDELTTVLTDAGAPPAMVAELEGRSIAVRLADPAPDGGSSARRGSERPRAGGRWP
jgi:DeoR/GlpR family transcriptional regulator of sugar metabolism